MDEAVAQDFAVIWDEGHDLRVIVAVERAYLAGLLSPICVIGERKGSLTVLVTPESSRQLGPIGLERYRERLRPLADVEGDSWSIDVAEFGTESQIISAPPEHVDLYLRGIDLLWQLGSKPLTP